MSERLYPTIFPPQRCVISVQARMASTRLPRKVLAEVMRRPLLAYQLERLKLGRRDIPIVVATTTDAVDDPIMEVAADAGASVYQGSPTDVPARHLRVAMGFGADLLGFCGADQVFVSAEHFEIAFRRLRQRDCDYVRVVGLPHGLHVWAVTREALEACVADESRTADEIEHTGAYWDARPEQFRTVDLDMGYGDTPYRLTVDTPEDLELHRLLLEALYPQLGAHISVEDLIAVLDAHPEWAAINADVQQYYWQGAANRPRVHA